MYTRFLLEIILSLIHTSTAKKGRIKLAHTYFSFKPIKSILKGIYSMGTNKKEINCKHTRTNVHANNNTQIYIWCVRQRVCAFNHTYTL